MKTIKSYLSYTSIDNPLRGDMNSEINLSFAKMLQRGDALTLHGQDDNFFIDKTEAEQWGDLDPECGDPVYYVIKNKEFFHDCVIIHVDFFLDEKENIKPQYKHLWV